MILKVTKNQGFTPSLEKKFWKATRGVKFTPAPAFLELINITAKQV